MLSDAELKRRLADLESDRVERSSVAGKLDKIAEAICAFANDLPNTRETGVIFIGVHDDGRCAGLDITDQLLASLGGLRSDGNILPIPMLSVRRVVLDGCPLAVIEVEPSENPPVRYRGRAFIRVGPRRAIAGEEEERRLTEKRRWGTLPFDQHPVSDAGLADLDLLRFREEYLPSAVPPEVLEQNNRREEDQLRALRLLHRDGTPTVTAILVLGRDGLYWLPGAYVQFVRYDGCEVTSNIVDQEQIAGPFSQQLRDLDRVLAAHNTTAMDTSGDRHALRPAFPQVTLSELVRNAVIHRSYERTHAPVRVTWFGDRIEILSPGGPYGQVTVSNFGQTGMTDYRNPALMEAARNLGFAQRFGRGIALARQELARNGNPPLELLPSPDHVLVIVRPAR